MKKIFILVAFLSITGSAIAETTIQQIQSPIYTDEIGRSHFLGRGGYSSVRQGQMNGVQADFVNDAVNKYSVKKENVESEINSAKKDIETNVLDVIKEKPTVPVSSKTKATFNTEDRKMDASASFGQGATYLPSTGVTSSGVNASKTMYTDEIGRLHFFGKGNLIKE